MHNDTQNNPALERVRSVLITRIEAIEAFPAYECFEERDRTRIEAFQTAVAEIDLELYHEKAERISDAFDKIERGEIIKAGRTNLTPDEINGMLEANSFPIMTHAERRAQ